MNVVDSWAWLKYFADGSNAEHLVKPIENPDELLVPSTALTEVFKRIARQRDEATALRYIAVMRQRTVADLDQSLALRTTAPGLRHELPPANSIVYATAHASDAIVRTQDADFDELPVVKYWSKT